MYNYTNESQIKQEKFSPLKLSDLLNLFLSKQTQTFDSELVADNVASSTKVKMDKTNGT